MLYEHKLKHMRKKKIKRRVTKPKADSVKT